MSTILKRTFLAATIVYVLFYLGPLFVNPFSIINLAEAFTFGLLVYGGFYLGYTFLYTDKSKLDERTKNTIITLIVMLIALFIYYNPIKFPIKYNIIINPYLAIILLLAILVALLFTAKNTKNAIVFVILFAPSIIQGILMRVSYNAMIFYINNPNFTLFVIVIGFIGYYIYNNNRK